MNNFEFKSYTPTPNDAYGMMGIAKVKLYGKIVINFKHVKTKDGSGSFFCTNNYTMTDALGEKKYLPCVLLDSRDDEQELQDFIRDSVNRSIAMQNSFKQTTQSPGNYYPHGMTQQSQPISTGTQTMEMRNTTDSARFDYPAPPSSMSEVSQQEQIPF